MGLEFRIERVPNGRRYITNVTFAKSKRPVFFNWNQPLNYAEVRNTHGETVSSMIFTLRMHSRVGDIILYPNGIAVYLRDDDLWEIHIDSFVKSAAEKLYKEQNNEPAFEVQKFGDSVRKFHTTVQVGRKNYSTYYYRDAGVSMWATIAADHGQRVSQMAEKLYAYLGIDSISIEPYTVTIRMKFDWLVQKWNDEFDKIVHDTFIDLANAKPSQAEAREVVIETHGIHMRAWHTTFDVSKSHIHEFDYPLRPSSEQPLREIGETGASIVRRILKEVRGVKEVWIQPYEVEIVIGDAFSLDRKYANGKTIAEQVNQILIDVCGPITFTNKGR